MAFRPLEVEWIDGAREPRHPPDPRYPDGVDIDMTRGAHPFATCETQLKYPAPRCGLFVVSCRQCGQKVVITTAGRRDDPRSVALACLPSRSRKQ